MTRQQLATRRARVRLLRFAADVLHEEVDRWRSPQGAALHLARRLQSAGLRVSGADLLDYYSSRQALANIEDGVDPGPARLTAIARLDAEEQIAWHEDNVGGEDDA